MPQCGLCAGHVRNKRTALQATRIELGELGNLPAALPKIIIDYYKPNTQ